MMPFASFNADLSGVNPQQVFTQHSQLRSLRDPFNKPIRIKDDFLDDDEGDQTLENLDVNTQFSLQYNGGVNQFSLKTAPRSTFTPAFDTIHMDSVRNTFLTNLCRVTDHVARGPHTIKFTVDNKPSIETIRNILKQSMTQMPKTANGHHKQCDVFKHALEHNHSMLLLLHKHRLELDGEEVVREYIADKGVEEEEVTDEHVKLALKERSERDLLKLFRSRLERYSRFKKEKGWSDKQFVENTGLVRVKRYTFPQKKQKPYVGVPSMVTCEKFNARADALMNIITKMDMCVEKYNTYDDDDDGRRKRKDRSIPEPRFHTVNSIVREIEKGYEFDKGSQMGEVVKVLKSLEAGGDVVRHGNSYKRGTTFKKAKVEEESEVETVVEEPPLLCIDDLVVTVPKDDLDKIYHDCLNETPDHLDFGGFPLNDNEQFITMYKLIDDAVKTKGDLSVPVLVLRDMILGKAREILEMDAKVAEDAVCDYAIHNQNSVYHDLMCDMLRDAKMTAKTLATVRAIYIWELCNTRQNLYENYVRLFCNMRVDTLPTTPK
jgi:hypothetical protein